MRSVKLTMQHNPGRIVKEDPALSDVEKLEKWKAEWKTLNSSRDNHSLFRKMVDRFDVMVYTGDGALGVSWKEESDDEVTGLLLPALVVLGIEGTWFELNQSAGAVLAAQGLEFETADGTEKLLKNTHTRFLFTVTG